MRITFLGGAGTVTGSKFLVEAGRTRVLIDCGLFQGVKSLRNLNWRALPVPVNSFDAVVLTHAHIDHSGYLPVVVRDGFRGPVFCTPPTVDLCGILLPDSGHLQEEEARFANRHGFSRHHPALPLYNEEDALRATKQLLARKLEEPFEVKDLTLRFQRAGHILGAASVHVSDGKSSVLFSGDLGRQDDLLIPPPVPPAAADVIVMESTYGDEDHPERDPIEALAEIVQRTTDRDGVLLISSFAVGRAQNLLFALHRIFGEGRARRVAVVVDSPMARDVTDLYLEYHDYHRLSEDLCRNVCSEASFTNSVEDSKRLNHRRGPLIIISASGMLSGGRVLHHLERLAPNPANTILLPGFQSPGTRGADLVAGVRAIKVHGEYVRVEAEVVQLGLLSAHADRGELMNWVKAADPAPREVLLVHGERLAADHLRRAIEEKLRLPARAAELNEVVEV